MCVRGVDGYREWVTGDRAGRRCGIRARDAEAEKGELACHPSPGTWLLLDLVVLLSVLLAGILPYLRTVEQPVDTGGFLEALVFPKANIGRVLEIDRLRDLATDETLLLVQRIDNRSDV